MTTYIGFLQGPGWVFVGLCGAVCVGLYLLWYVFDEGSPKRVLRAMHRQRTEHVNALAEVVAELERRDAESAKRLAEVQRQNAEREAEETVRAQRRDAESAKRLAEVQRQNAEREAEETVRVEREASERMRQLRGEAETIIRLTMELLLKGDHRRAWQALHADGLSYGEAIGSDPGLESTAEELSRRIGWSWKREIAEQRRGMHLERLRSAGLIDFDQLDRALADDGGANRRPALVGVVYSITMPDGEVYIGKTTRDPEARWEEHRREADGGDMKPKSLALRYWSAQGRAHDVRWCVEERVMGWGEEDLDCAEKRWMRMGTLNVMVAVRAATIYAAS